ncbi:hypothetical protein hamaS1_27450 [Moorella sp. Hama-1]|nr:hypothetical protein hamaS1_27450 [Moorella sp. Hama-1]
MGLAGFRNREAALLNAIEDYLFDVVVVMFDHSFLNFYDMADIFGNCCHEGE